MKKTVIAIMSVVAILCAGYFALELTGTMPGAEAPVIAPAKPTSTPMPPRQGEASRKLGHKPLDFGSQGQARELLKLMEEEPFKAEYVVSYWTDGADVVRFACSFERSVIVRVRKHPDGHGTMEFWGGFVLERLESAASGGSLNDTPAGKKFGEMESF